MNDTLIAALESMLALQRWNFLPRIETWVEAENATYVTHLAYAIGRTRGMPMPQVSTLLVRSLLKSLNKHYMTDINVTVREKLKEKNGKAWTRLVDETARKAAGLFPRKIGAQILPYLTDAPSYTIPGQAKKAGDIKAVEEIVKYAQLKVALQECKTNARIYEADYRKIVADLDARIAAIPHAREYDALAGTHAEYFQTICRMRHLRRWNRINRIVSSTVLGHTYLVAALSITFALLAEKRQGDVDAFLYRCILRALFHDVPESLTGDIITPVKEVIAKEDDLLLEQVEEDLAKEFIASAPPDVRKDLVTYNLLADWSDDGVYSADSLVWDCDRLALLLECLYERKAGVRTPEIATAFARYYQEIEKSEWSALREFASTVRVFWFEQG